MPKSGMILAPLLIVCGGVSKFPPRALCPCAGGVRLKTRGRRSSNRKHTLPARHSGATPLWRPFQEAKAHGASAS